MNSENIVFSNGQLKYSGTLHKPGGKGPYPALVVIHAANGATRGFPFYEHLAAQLPEAGIAVFLFDRRGSGGSTGQFEMASFPDLAGDVAAAIDQLSQRSDIDPERIALYGISQGGWIAPIVAIRRPNIRCVVIVSGAGMTPAEQMKFAISKMLRKSGYSNNEIEDVMNLYEHVNDYYSGKKPYNDIKQEISKAQNEQWFSYIFQDTLVIPNAPSQDRWYYELDFNPLPFWKRVHQPTLFIFANQDQWIPLEQSVKNLRRATENLGDVSFIQIDGTNHFMGTGDEEGSPAVSSRYLEILLSWLEIHLCHNPNI